jgi:CBS domain-containing protein
MRVDDIMTRDVAACAQDDTLNRAAELMWERDCGVIPVREGKRVVGVVTDRDCCMAAYTKGRRLDEIGVGETMSREVNACAPGDTLAEVERRMAQFQIRRMPVLNDGHLVGIVSMNDIALAAQRGQASPDEIAETLAAVCRHRGQPQPLAAE